MSAEFDKFADNYNKKHDECVGAVSGTDRDYFSEYKIKILQQKKALNKNGVWLDLGCGDGNTAKYVNEYFPGYEYHGIDVSKKSIEVAKEKHDCRGSFWVYDGVHIEKGDNTYDVIYIATVLHHVPPEQWKTLLAECRRVLKPDGKLVIFEHNPWNPVTRKIVKDCVFDKDAVLLSSKTCVKLLSEIGYHNISKNYSVFFPRKGVFNLLVNLEKCLTWCPLGGQYYVIANKIQGRNGGRPT